MVLALGISAIPGMARIARGSAMVVMKQEYMEAGHAMGFGNFYLITRYLLPNCSSMLMIYATLQLGHTILLGSVLSFLGLGPQPPFAELGSMAADEMCIRDRPWSGPRSRTGAPPWSGPAAR